MNEISISNTKRFRIEQKIFNNSSTGSEVYIAMDSDLRRRIILKILHYADNEHRRVILEEINNQIALEQYSHYVPTLYNFFEEKKDSRIIIEMQYIEGRGLRDIIESAMKQKMNAVWYEKQYDLLLKIVESVSSIHGFRGFVHKDLKPENLVVGQGGSVYVLDYGISGLGLKDKGTGTERYMAPEQMLRTTQFFVCQATDVFALGQMALEMFGNKPIVYGESAIPDKSGVGWESVDISSEVGGGFFSELPVILSKALSLNPKDRYENAKALHEALKRGRKNNKHGYRSCR